MEILQNQLEGAARLQRALRHAGIESIVIGGLAVAVWAKPRVTKDADLKVLLSREQAEQLLAALPPEYQPLSANPKEDLQQRGFVRLCFYPRRERGEGVFVVSGAPGEYLVFVRQAGEPAQTFNAEYIRTHADKAPRVNLRSGERKLLEFNR